MTTLLSKAQKLIQKIRSDRHDIEDWPKDSLDAFLELEQAIAQELAFQTASTKPVVSQNFVFLTAETVNKICATCKHRPQSIWQSLMPECLVCETYNNWELSHED